MKLKSGSGVLGLAQLGQSFHDIATDVRLKFLNFLLSKKKFRKNVTVLDLSSNKLSSQEVNKYILSGKPYVKLKSLSLTNNLLNDQTLFVKSSKEILFPALETLHLDNCKITTLQKSLFENCPALTRLYINEDKLDQESSQFLERLKERNIQINFKGSASRGVFTGGSHISGNSCY